MPLHESKPLSKNTLQEPPVAAAWIAPERSASNTGLSAPSSSARRFAEAVSPHLPAMHRAAREVVGSDDLAWDAVQEALSRIWVQGWIPERPARALVHLAKKSGLHQLRCLRRRNHHESKSSSEAGYSCEHDPLAQLESEEKARIVREAVRNLTDEYRRVLELFEFEGHSYEAISEKLSVPVGTVRSRLSRGRALLREGLLNYFRAA